MLQKISPELMNLISGCINKCCPLYVFTQINCLVNHIIYEPTHQFNHFMCFD